MLAQRGDKPARPASSSLGAAAGLAARGARQCTSTPRRAYSASVPPGPKLSSSGWASTASSRRPVGKDRGHQPAAFPDDLYHDLPLPRAGVEIQEQNLTARCRSVSRPSTIGMLSEGPSRAAPQVGVAVVVAPAQVGGGSRGAGGAISSSRAAGRPARLPSYSIVVSALVDEGVKIVARPRRNARQGNDPLDPLGQVVRIGVASCVRSCSRPVWIMGASEVPSGRERRQAGAIRQEFSGTPGAGRGCELGRPVGEATAGVNFAW